VVSDATFSIAGQVALITGATGGIGADLAAAFATAGARVAVAGRRTDAAERIAARIRDGGGDARAIELDLTTVASIERGVAATGDAIDEASLSYYHAEFLRHYEGHTADRSEIFPGAVALLTRLGDSGIKAGVCTNKPEGLSRRLLDALDLSRLVGAIIGPDTIGIGIV